MSESIFFAYQYAVSFLLNFGSIDRKLFYIYLYTLAVSPGFGDSQQHKENNKNNGSYTPFF